MKDLIRMKITAKTVQVNDINEFSGVDKNLQVLGKEYRIKDKIINILLENLFEQEITSVTDKDSSVIFSQSKKSGTEFRNP